jgi:putative ABC transport system permease protein
MLRWWSKLQYALERRRGLNDDLGDEIGSHIEFLYEENLARGMAPGEARANARRRFGNPTVTRERAVETWRFSALETVVQDLRYGLRSIRKAPGFAMLILLTLALGIGATTAIFSVVYSALLRPLPYPAVERLTWLGESTPKASGVSVTWINFQHWRSENHAFEDMAAFRWTDRTLTGKGEAVVTHGLLVTSAFFHLTGWRPLIGRLPSAADDQPGAAPVALVSYEFWAKTLGGNLQAAGEVLDLDGKPYQAIGVLPPGVKYGQPADYYLPLGPEAGKTVIRSQHGSIRALGLLKRGVSLDAARADLDGIMRRLALSDPGPEDDHRSYAEFLTETVAGDARTPLVILMAAVGLVLLIACANAASLLLMRGVARAREIAIRAAIGAGRGRLARQLVTESLALAALGGAAGVLLAWWWMRALVFAGPAGIPRLSEVKLDLPVLGFAAAAAIFSGLLAGIAPLLAAQKLDLTVALKEGSGAVAGGRRGNALRYGLVIGEIALTLVLAFASGLLIRSLVVAQTADPGYDHRHLLALELQLPGGSYKADDAKRQYFQELTRKLRAQPGVESVGTVNVPPSGGESSDFWYSIADQPAPARQDVPITLFNVADSGYFSAMGIRLLAGRWFTDGDQPGGPAVAVVNEQFARKWWSDPQRAIGHRIKYGGPYMPGDVYQIVGVAAGVSQMGLDTTPYPEVWRPFAQQPLSAMVVMMRTAGAPAGLMAAARRQVVSLDRSVPIQSLKPFDEWLGDSLQLRRFLTFLLAIFAGLAMVLAAGGIYGVLNYWVNAHQKEIAIRLAMGARRSAIFGWAARHAMRLALAGVALGGLAAWGVSRSLHSLVFGVSAGSPWMILGATAAVMGLAALSAGVPLWRAVRVDAARWLHDS